MYKSQLAFKLLALSLLINHASAATIINTTDTTPIKASAIVTKAPHNLMASSSPIQYHDVYLMKINLTTKEKQKFQHIEPRKIKPLHTSTLPTRISLGMNNVPVLNQGKHGSCVTFANTAALDALLNRGDYISQLCLLEFSEYLQKRSYFPSGWDGNYGPFVLDRLIDFGIVSKSKQIAQGCSGVREYPVSDPNNTGNPMSIDDYASLSEDINNRVYWASLLTPDDFDTDENTDDLGGQTLEQIKHILADPYAKLSARVTFGMLLAYTHCSAGACATFHKTNDTFVLSDEIINEFRQADPIIGGHELVITGYDDNATAIDKSGVTHTGLLTLRNSWSDQVGDNGDYYMSYDYFAALAMEAQKIAKHHH